MYVLFFVISCSFRFFLQNIALSSAVIELPRIPACYPKIACYLGFITQAITANFAPLLFLKFHFDYRISLGNIE